MFPSARECVRTQYRTVAAKAGAWRTYVWEEGETVTGGLLFISAHSLLYSGAI